MLRKETYERGYEVRHLTFQTQDGTYDVIAVLYDKYGQAIYQEAVSQMKAEIEILGVINPYISFC